MCGVDEKKLISNRAREREIFRFREKKRIFQRKFKAEKVEKKKLTKNVEQRTELVDDDARSR